MNYDHAFHAGNFADVVKHAVLTRLVDYLKRKDKAFRVIDTHAGSGLYDLSSDQAQRTGEWRSGIGRLLAANLPDGARGLLQPYVEAVESVNPRRGLNFYPGSPALIRHLLRSQDRLTAIELHPAAAAALQARFAGDFQARIIELDGWLALGAQVPPKEKRGLVLVDPPFEVENEFARIVDGLRRAHARWPSGIYAFWYPIKDRAAATGFRAALSDAGIPRILDIRLSIRAPSPAPRLDGTGLVVVNPPFVLEEELRTILPVLRDVLGEDKNATWELEWLAGEQLPG